MDHSAHANPHVTTHVTIDDDTMVRRIGYCGVIVALVAFAIAWVANTVA